MVVKRWWSERLRQYLYLRKADDGFRMTVELHFATREAADEFVEQWKKDHRSDEWRHQPL